MNDPDPDLREAFQRWRRQEAAEAPVFSLPSPSRRGSRKWILQIAAPACALVLVAIWQVATPPKRNAPFTLAEAMPRPLLAPAGPGGFALGMPAPLIPATSPSDFLIPIHDSIPLFP
jgi:hypothetical protein